MAHKKITAKFETVDLAEFAARGIKNNFDQINHIKIRYKNNPKDDYSENKNREPQDEFFNYPALAGVAAGIDTGGSTLLPVYVHLHKRNEDLNDRHDIPEIEQTTESRIIVEADSAIAKQIASKLRCLGGYQIEVF